MVVTVFYPQQNYLGNLLVYDGNILFFCQGNISNLLVFVTIIALINYFAYPPLLA